MRSPSPPRRPLAWLALLGPLAACDEDGGGVFNRGDPEEEAELSPTFVAQWNADDLVVFVHGGASGSWWLGLAQTDGDDRDAWTGEDCFRGDTLAEADTAASEEAVTVAYCHPLLPLRTELRYGADPLTLVPGEATSLEDASYKARMSFYFYDTISGGCWVGGHRPDYYADLCDTVVEVIER